MRLPLFPQRLLDSNEPLACDTTCYHMGHQVASVQMRDRALEGAGPAQSRSLLLWAGLGAVALTRASAKNQCKLE
jgi:hypothetical protein